MPSGAKADLTLAQDASQGGVWLHSGGFCFWVASCVKPAALSTTKGRKEYYEYVFSIWKSASNLLSWEYWQYYIDENQTLVF